MHAPHALHGPRLHAPGLFLHLFLLDAQRTRAAGRRCACPLFRREQALFPMAAGSRRIIAAVPRLRAHGSVHVKYLKAGLSLSLQGCHHH